MNFIQLQLTASSCAILGLIFEITLNLRYELHAKNEWNELFLSSKKKQIKSKQPPEVTTQQLIINTFVHARCSATVLLAPAQFRGTSGPGIVHRQPWFLGRNSALTVVGQFCGFVREKKKNFA